MEELGGSRVTRPEVLSKKFRAARPCSGHAGTERRTEMSFLAEGRWHTKEDSPLWRTHGYLPGRP